MSRIGKKSIIIPKDTEVKQEGSTITVKGLKGERSRVFRTEVEIKVNDGKIDLLPTNNSILCEKPRERTILSPDISAR